MCSVFTFVHYIMRWNNMCNRHGSNLSSVTLTGSSTHGETRSGSHYSRSMAHPVCVKILNHGCSVNEKSGFCRDLEQVFIYFVNDFSHVLI